MLDTVVRAGSYEAVLFDLDGTLYEQSPVRREMLRRLCRAHASKPVTGIRVLRLLAAYRRAQEQLRTSGFVGDVASTQVELTMARTGEPESTVRRVVERWMETEPLRAVAANRRPDLSAVLDQLSERGSRLGVVSDYPAHDKLEALGVADRFPVVVSAQDRRVDAFKPNPRALLVALEELDVDPSDALYVGDRVDVDEAAATAAGMSFALVGSRARARRTNTSERAEAA